MVIVEWEISSIPKREGSDPEPSHGQLLKLVGVRLAWGAAAPSCRPLRGVYHDTLLYLST